MSQLNSEATIDAALNAPIALSVPASTSESDAHKLRPPAERFHGLDAARAAAMLLGVFYHLPIAFMGGGGFFGGATSPKSSIDLWLHSFRMPLFFLISGFFACMMLKKYGIARYYQRRGWRIGAALIVSFLLLVVFRITVEQIQRSAPVRQPPAAIPGFGFGPPGGVGAVPPAGPGFGPIVGPAMGPGNGPANGPVQGQVPGFGPPPAPGATGGFGPPATGAAGPPLFTFPGMPSRKWSTLLFGSYAKHMSLEHLWFLWYLLLMVSIAPLVAAACGGIGDLFHVATTRNTGVKLAKWNLLGMAIGVVGLPLLIHARNFMGWSLANPHGFLGAFPDFLVQYCPDWLHYGFYFAIGWWMFINRDVLISLERHWKWSIAIGVIGFSISQWLATNYGFNPLHANGGWIRFGAFLLYGVGAAYSVLGFLGVFQKYLNKPNRVVRYFADTALWVYLVHLPLIPYVIGWVEPWRATWWEASLGGMLVVTGVSIALYELLVRPTVLMYVYGPATALSKSAK